MNARTLERLFVRFALVATPLAGAACSSSSASSPDGGTDFYAQCGSQPPGETQVSLSVLSAAEADAGSGTDGGGAPVDLDAGAEIPLQVCLQLCPPSGVTTGLCHVHDVHGDAVTLDCVHDCTGRRPDGLKEGACDGTFAEMARLEAASVHAFRRLRAELAHHGAPRSILRACSRAARDEVRHARTTRALARRRGQETSAPIVGPMRARSLEALALENAVEGCVRETWGAFQATRTAHAHAELDVRAAMKRIARDETRHAALAWTLAAWLEPRLDAAARERVRAARDAEARTIAARSDAAERAAAAALWEV
jgi:hypothetical protein